MTEQTNQQAHEHEEEHVCNKEFDLKNEYLEQVAPLIKQLHAKCKELDLPLALAITYANDGKGTHQGVAFNFNGCRTPKEYHAARVMIEGNTPGFALGLVMATTKFNQE